MCLLESGRGLENFRARLYCPYILFPELEVGNYATMVN